MKGSRQWEQARRDEAREARTLLCIILRPHLFAHNTLLRCKMVMKGHIWESKKLEKMLECEGGGRRAKSVHKESE